MHHWKYVSLSHFPLSLPVYLSFHDLELMLIFFLVHCSIDLDITYQALWRPGRKQNWKANQVGCDWSLIDRQVFILVTTFLDASSDIYKWLSIICSSINPSTHLSVGPSISSLLMLTKFNRNQLKAMQSSHEDTLLTYLALVWFTFWFCNKFLNFDCHRTGHMIAVSFTNFWFD